MQACSKNTLKIALEISCRNRQRLEFSWSSSSRVRNTSLQIKIKIYFDDFLVFHVALQYLLKPIKGIEVRSNIHLHHTNFGDTSAELWYN
jgi:hypothetical protein